jgi:hypothetical protein
MLVLGGPKINWVGCDLTACSELRSRILRRISRNPSKFNKLNESNGKMGVSRRDGDGDSVVPAPQKLD